MFTQAFHAVAKILTLYEATKDSWHHAVIVGHTQMSKLFPLNSAKVALLQEMDFIVVSQLFATNDLTGILDRQVDEALMYSLRHYPFLTYILQLLRSQLHHHNFLDKTSVAVSTCALLIRKEHVSQTYKKILRLQLHNNMKLPLAYSTQDRDGVYVPEKQTFKDAFLVFSLPFLSSKTKEIAFQILNRSVWTNQDS
jgi:hypothetical protein